MSSGICHKITKIFTDICLVCHQLISPVKAFLLLISYLLRAVLRIYDILRWSWSGSGFADPCLWLMDWPSRCQQKTNLKKKFFCLFFLKVHLHHFSKTKIQKEVTRDTGVGIKVFLPFFAWSGAGSRRPKNIRIRIRNTYCACTVFFVDLCYIGSVGTRTDHSNGLDTIQFDQEIRIQRWNSWSSRTLKYVQQSRYRTVLNTNFDQTYDYYISKWRKGNKLSEYGSILTGLVPYFWIFLSPFSAVLGNHSHILHMSSMISCCVETAGDSVLWEVTKECPGNMLLDIED